MFLEESQGVGLSGFILFLNRLARGVHLYIYNKQTDL